MKHTLLKTFLAAIHARFKVHANAKDFFVDGIYYSITSSTDKTVEVKSGGSSSRYSGNISIPASVTYEGRTYAVTCIGNEAFLGRTGLTSVKIPNSVTSIGDNAFRSCTGVTSIGNGAFTKCRSLSLLTSYAATPPTCGSYAFDGIDKAACTLHVPAGTKSQYQAASGWKYFKNIVEDAEMAFYKFVGDSSGKSAIVPSSMSGLLDIVDSRNNLEKLVENLSESLPDDQGTGMVITSAELDGNYFVFTITCDDDSMDVSLLDNDKVRELLLKKFKETYPTTELGQYLVKLCLQGNVGLLYKYVGDPSGKSVSVPISVSQLRSMVEENNE